LCIKVLQRLTFPRKESRWEALKIRAPRNSQQKILLVADRHSRKQLLTYSAFNAHLGGDIEYFQHNRKKPKHLETGENFAEPPKARAYVLLGTASSFGIFQPIRDRSFFWS
jgi:hypothetical protein